MRQNGQRARNRLGPADADELGLAPMDGPPVTSRISPDGTKVALHLLRLRVPGRRLLRRPHDTGIIPSDRFASTPEYGKSYFRSPSWVTDTRIFNSGGYGSHVNIQDLGTEPYNWLTDQETDLGDAELTRGGRQARRGARLRQLDAHRLVLGRRQRALRPQAADPDRRSARPASRPGSTSPTWAPDGTRSPGREPDGIWIHRDAAGCEHPAAQAGAARRLGGRLGAPRTSTPGRARRPAAVGRPAAAGPPARRCGRRDQRRRRPRAAAPPRWRSR